MTGIEDKTAFCFGRTMLYMCMEYHIYVNMYHVSTQGIDEHIINVQFYYYYYVHTCLDVPCVSKLSGMIFPGRWHHFTKPVNQLDSIVLFWVVGGCDHDTYCC